MNRIHTLLIIILISIFFNIEIFSQDTTTSLVYKNNKPPQRTNFFYRPDPAYRLWQQFTLIREANAGNSLAQHELGLRYLLGDGLPADTLQGATWIKKAADQNLAAASFNYGILLLNGWGVSWNPFEAFKHFYLAAESGMSNAEHIVGLFYTDNLIVKRDWAEAYRWIKKAANKDYLPAQESLEELITKIPVDLLDTAFVKSKTSIAKTQDDNSLTSSLGLVFIDFDSITDSAAEITDEMLISDLSNYGNDTLKQNAAAITNFDFTFIPLLIKYADNGSPEALTLLGRIYETGIYFKKDFITAAAYYIRAFRLDSPRAPRLLYDLLKYRSPMKEIQMLTERNDPEALFAWYGLNILGYDFRITEADALNLLQKSASLGYIPAIIELGLNNFTGNYLTTDKNKAIDLWQTAVNFDNNEAKIRLATGVIFDEISGGSYKEAIDILKKFSEEGSVLAQAALAYAFEYGKGVQINKAEAVRYYRYAAQRGSRFAYNELKRIYDEIRPDDSQFGVY